MALSKCRPWWVPRIVRRRTVWALCGLSLMVTFYMPSVSDYWKQNITRRVHLPSLHQQRSEVGYSQPKCHKHMHVAFIKIHKAASTTITSILQRYGLFHNLTFALPPKSNFLISLFETVNSDNVLPITNGTTFDILCQHVIYNKEAFAKMFPPDTVTIATIREPFQRLVSSFLFFRVYGKEVSRKNETMSKDTVGIIRTYLEDPERYEPPMFQRGSIALNRISLSLGMTPVQYANKTFVDEYIKILDKDLTFVLVVELLDECLVLLKRKLCWSMKDILYQWRYKGPAKPKIPQDILERHKMLAPSEYQLYEHFHNKVTKELESQGSEFWEETKLFKSCLERVNNFCKTVENVNITELTVPASQFEGEFTFTRYDCKFLFMSEIDMIKLLRRRQSSPRPVE